jgi:hypothetical protein
MDRISLLELDSPSPEFPAEEEAIPFAAGEESQKPRPPCLLWEAEPNLLSFPWAI